MIWLGALEPRMLQLAGARADGWLPSLGYLAAEAIPDVNNRFDGAAVG